MNNFQIIVPTLNSFGVLNKLIESLQIQTWRFWRVIFVDGESNYEHVSWLKYQCLKDKRFSYIKQRRENIGIFGAMNQGLEMADQKNWILFWGSDDWVFDTNTLEILNKKIIRSTFSKADIIVCKGKYFSLEQRIFTRNAQFKKFEGDTIINQRKFKNLIFKGLTPPHQTTLMNPKLFIDRKPYDDKLRIAADLDFFCRLANYKNISVGIVNLNLVIISSGGVSAKNHFKRLKEVLISYKGLFKRFYLIPFILRYFYKIFQIIV